MRKPDFENLLKVLRCEVPSRPTLFEFFLNGRLYARLCGDNPPDPSDPLCEYRRTIRSFRAAGYDYATVHGADVWFPIAQQRHEKSISQNEGALIHDRASFEAYSWPDPDAADYSRLETLRDELPDGMKFVVFSHSGVLENAVGLVGYENICLLIRLDPELAQDVFDAIGSRLVRYYEHCAPFEAVGALISNDDWGFRTQTIFSPDEMRRFVFPWHKRIVAAIHAAGKPAILHSCGNLSRVMDDVIDDMGYDAKHSFEDAIQPIEAAYEQYVGRIALLGGIDLDYLIRSSADEVKARVRAMLDRSATRGGWAIGSGNSIPDYVPDEQYFALISVVSEG